MNTWPNRGASGGPCGGLEERENPKTQTPNLSIRSTRSDSSQQASAKPGVVQFDSMYRGYPVGYFLFWQTGAEGVDTKVIGDTNKQKSPSLLIVDGQQRLTSLYAVIRREAVLRENFQREHIRVAFRPQSGTFAVPDATTERDPEYILDISEVFNRPTHKTIGEYLKRLSAARDVTDAEEETVAEAIGRLAGLTNFPFIALELSQTCTEEQVADVFVRINSEGKKLNQSDIILTLMSVFWDDGRTELETFCRAARQPAGAGQATPGSP